MGEEKKIGEIVHCEHDLFGDTVTDEFKREAFDLCKSYLGYSWAEVTFDDFELSCVAGGLTNYLYLCQANKPDEESNGKPKKVLLRKFGESVDVSLRLNETLVFSILGERKIGPRVLGLLNDGRLEEFFYGKILSTEEIGQVNYIKQVASIIAEYHLMDIPLKKEPYQFKQQVIRLLNYFNEHIDDAIGKNDCYVEQLKYMKNFDFKNTVDWLYSVVEASNFPVVFCHNDLNEGNIMKIINEETGKEELRLIDFEYSSYHYRGYDLGNYFNEVMIDNNGEDEYPFFKYDFKMYPSQKQQLAFAEVYLERLNILLEKNKNGLVDKFKVEPQELLKEANFLSLLSHIYWALWGFSQYMNSKIHWGFAEYSKVRIDMFKHFKKEFAA